MSILITCAAAGCGSALILPAAAEAQVASGGLTGLVKDDAGAVPGATVTVT